MHSGDLADSIFFGVFLIAYPIGNFFTGLPSSRPNFKHASILISVFFVISIPNLQWGFLQLFFDALWIYLVAANFRGPSMPCFVMGHLTVNREVWLIHETLDISSAQIILAMKLTMFEWNVYDGQKLKKDLDQFQFQKRITKYPMLLEFLGYTTIGLTWDGTTYTWGSVNVLIPLVLGLVGLGTFIAYEVTLTKYPLVPFSLSHDKRDQCQRLYTDVFLPDPAQHDSSADYLQIYLQACKGVSPIVYSLSLASYALATIITGISIKATGRYRPQAWIGWVLTVISFGLLSTLLATDPLGKLHMMVTVTLAYPIQAPVPVTQNAPALAFMWFLRSFASVWGITVGGTVLQNELAKKLPEPFVDLQGTSIIYALIPELSKLPPQTLSEVQAAFANGLTVLWRVLAALSGVGLLMSLFLRGLPLHNTLDEDWALKNEKADPSI